MHIIQQRQFNVKSGFNVVYVGIVGVLSSPQQRFQNEHRRFFVQRLIVVAALGALDAGGAASLAGTFPDG